MGIINDNELSIATDDDIDRVIERLKNELFSRRDARISAAVAEFVEAFNNLKSVANYGFEIHFIDENRTSSMMEISDMELMKLGKYTLIFRNRFIEYGDETDYIYD